MKNNMIFIAGPCVIESEELVMQIAEYMCQMVQRLPVDYDFKASFDKANRTSLTSFRGPGLEQGIAILDKVKNRFQVKIATDIHEPWQAEPVAQVADIIQIPAFLCRQTDLLVAAAKTGRKINVKKAQFLAPSSMRFVADKLAESGNKNIMLCERGSSFGYGNLVVDMTGLVEMKKLGYPVIFDGTHSVQKPGGSSTDGNREYVPALVRAAAAVGIDGLFLEVHPDPDHALSDGPNMVTLENCEKILKQFVQISNLIGEYADEKD